MRHAKLIVALVLLGIIGFWGYRKFFPPDQVVIRNLLVRAAETASFQPSENALNKLTSVKWLVNQCTPDVQLSLDIQGSPIGALQGREQLGEALAAIRATAQFLSVELIDIGVELEPSGDSAIAQFIARARLDSAQDQIVQEFRVKLLRQDGEWRFQHIEALPSMRM